jgi:hypothetical protein
VLANNEKATPILPSLDNMPGTIAIASSTSSGTPDTGSSTDGAARSATPTRHIGGIAQPKGNGSSNIRTVFFEILGACVGVATLVVAVLALRAMPKQRQHDPESSPVTDNGDQPYVGVELPQLPSYARHGTSTSVLESGLAQPAVDTQSQETETSK